MRPELRTMLDGSTVVKQAVLTKPIHFDQQGSSAPPSAAPAITCTPASSTSFSSSKKDTSSVNSHGTEDTSSSTESHKHRGRRERLGPAETGSIESLRRDNKVRHSLSIDEPDDGATAAAISMVRRHTTLPSSHVRSSKPPRMADLTTLLILQKKQQQQQQKRPEWQVTRQLSGPDDINTQPFLLLPKKNSRESPEPTFEDRTSDSSLDSKSIDGVVEEYIQMQKEEQSLTDIQQAPGSRSKYRRSKSQEGSLKGDEEVPRYRGEADDHIVQLPSPRISTLPRKLNEKLLRQNRLSVSVPSVYHPAVANGKPKPEMRNNYARAGSDHGSMEFPLSVNRDLSASVPNLARSNTSLNSIGHHDLTITGEIKFSLSYNYKTNILLVNVAECRNIATADRRRKRSDPYVKCYLLPDRKNKQKTDVKKRTLNPTYNKCLKFSVSHSELSTRVLELSVWHAGTFTRNLFLGQVQLPLDTWNWDSQNQNWFPLRQRNAISADFVRETVYKGDLVIGLKFTSSGSASPGKHKAPFGELNILIKQAKNLTPVRSNGTVDAYVKIMLQPDKQFRQKTAVIPKNASPEWNHNVRMQLYQPMEESGLQLTIWHRDKLQGSTFLGGCRLNPGPSAGHYKWMDAAGMEKSLWETALNSPGQWVDDTIQLRPSM